MLLIRASSKIAVSMEEVNTRMPRPVNPTLERTNLVSLMVKVNTSRQTKKDTKENSAMENVMARVIGGKIKLTKTRRSIVANGNMESFTEPASSNGTNLHTTRANSTTASNMVAAHLTSKMSISSTRVSSRTTRDMGKASAQ